MARIYYGWIVLGIAALAMVGTLPGRTQGLGLVTEPLLADLQIDRVTYATLNFWATLIGAAGALGVGRAIDRSGSRTVLTVVAFALGAVVIAMSRVTGVVALAIALTLTRAIGQSALSVVSLAMVGQWFTRRIDTAMAAFTIVMSVGFMIAFPVVGAMVQARGWRAAWLAIGIALVAVLAPLAWLFVRRGPEAIGVAADGDEARTGYAWREAIGTGAFWIFAIGAALYGLVASGIGLFNESILAERSFGPEVYYQTLVVTALTALVGNFGGGWLARKMALERLLAGSLAILAAGLAFLPQVTTIGGVMTWAAAMGLGGGVVIVLFFSIWPRAFGRPHLGRIQGSAQAITVLASAVGPLLLAWGVERAGSYAPAFYVLAAAIALTAVAALAVSIPTPARARAPVTLT